MIMMNLKLKYSSYDSAAYNRNEETIMHNTMLLVMKTNTALN